MALNRKKIAFALMGISLLLAAFSITLPQGSADTGMAPWPPDVHLSETGQKAIVAWDGSEEVLILSTDVKSTSSATTLRIMPLPSNPTKVEEGSFSSFENIVSIINKKTEATRSQQPTKGFAAGPAEGPPPITVTFHAKLGPHDVTIVKVNDLEYFVEWIENFTSRKGLTPRVLPENFKDSVENYINKGCSHFVFDVIQTGENEKSYTPLVYRFETDSLYYPLVITGNSVGLKSQQDEIQLFLITKGRIKSETVEKIGLRAGVGFGEWIEFSSQELSQIDPEIAEIFESDPFVMKSSYFGRLPKLKKDLIIPQDKIHVPSFFERALHRLYSYGKSNHIFQFIQTLSSGIFSHYPLYGQIISLFILSVLLVGIPTSVFMIGKLIGSIVEEFTQANFPMKTYYGTAAFWVILLILFSTNRTVALVAEFTFAILGSVGLLFLLRTMVRFLER